MIEAVDSRPCFRFCGPVAPSRGTCKCKLQLAETLLPDIDPTFSSPWLDLALFWPLKLRVSPLLGQILMLIGHLHICCLITP